MFHDAREVSAANKLYGAREIAVDEIGKTLGVSRKTVYRYLEGAR